MSQLYVAGIVNTWDSQIAKSGFMDSNYYVMLSGNMTENDVSSAVAIKYTGGTSGWQKTFPGQFSTFFTDMTQLTDGSYMATGTYFTSGNAGDENIWLVNIDAAGNETWNTQVGQPGTQSDGMAIAATTDGGFIVAGMQLQSGNISTLILKYDAGKNVVWQKSIPDFVCFSMHANTDGTFILSGRNTTTGMNSSPVAILMDGAGNITLNTTFSSFSLYILQGTDAIQTADGNFVMVAKNVLIKFDVTGNVIWSVNTANGVFSSVAELANGNLVIGGSTLAANTAQAYVVVTDSDGDTIVWDNSEAIGPSGYNSVFIDPRVQGGVVWGAGYAFTNVLSSSIIFTAFNPATSLAGHGTAEVYALADTTKKSVEL